VRVLNLTVTLDKNYIAIAHSDIFPRKADGIFATHKNRLFLIFLKIYGERYRP